MDGGEGLISTEARGGELATGTIEKVDGIESPETQSGNSTTSPKAITIQQNHIKDSEPVKVIFTPPEKIKILLGQPESPQPGNSKSGTQKLEDDGIANKVSQEVNGNKERTDVSQVKQCPYCPFEYCGPRDLAPHVKEVHAMQYLNGNGRVRYKCLYCDESNTRPRILRRHMHVLHPDHFSVQDLQRTLKVRCKEEGCGKSFTCESKLRNHLIADHGHRDVKTQWDKVYDEGRMRERAERVEKGEHPTWGQRSAETKHKPSSVHTEKHKSSRLRDCHAECWRKAREGSGFLCSYCNKKFTHHSLCVGHERTHENKHKQSKGFTCDHCNETFSTSDQLVDHRNLAHEMSAVGDDEESVPKANTGVDKQCPQCERHFVSAYYIKQHIETVHDKKAKYVCTDCGKCYLRKDGLTYHRENSHNPTPCPRRSKPARFTCPICGVNLTSKTGMKAHINKHNGVRPYACRYCERSFTSMNHRTAHESIHSGVKAHRCPICYKVFTNVGTLYNHLYRYKVHGVIPRGSLSGHGSNVDALLRAAELCQQSQPKKTPRASRLKSCQKPELRMSEEIVGQGAQGLAPAAPPADMAPQSELTLVDVPTVVQSEQPLVQHDLDQLSTTAAGDTVLMVTQHSDSDDTTAQHIDSDGTMTRHIDSDGTKTQHINTSDGAARHIDSAGTMIQHIDSSGKMTQHTDCCGTMTQHIDSRDTIIQHTDSSDTMTQHIDSSGTIIQHIDSNGRMTQHIDSSDTVTQHIDCSDTQVLIESESAPSGGVVLTSDDGQLNPLSVQKYTTLLHSGSQLTTGQEIRIVRVDDNSAGSDRNITIPSGQQIAFIILPQHGNSHTIDNLNDDVYIQIDMEGGGGIQGPQQQWGLGQLEGGGGQGGLGGDIIVDCDIPMDGAEYVTERSDFTTVSASSI